MAFKIETSREAEIQINHCIEYILCKFKSYQGASGLSDDIENAYCTLTERADSFGYCDDPYLAVQGYREIKLEHYKYLFIFRLDDNIVYIAGFFHMLENYAKKL